MLSKLAVSILVPSIIATTTYLTAPAHIEVDFGHGLSAIEQTTPQEAYNAPETIIKEVWGKDYAIGIAIATCESHMTHYGEGGSILRGKITPQDLGVMQISLTYHFDTARKLGYNLADMRDNIRYAYYLYTTQGTQPWRASRGCWSKS